MPEKYFFDTSAFLAIIRSEPEGAAIGALNDRLRRSQCFTSVLVAYELFRGIPLSAARRKAQTQVLNELLDKFTRKSVFEAHALAAARVHRFSRGAIDPILAAQCVDGGFTLVTTNRQDFERVPDIKLYDL